MRRRLFPGDHAEVARSLESVAAGDVLCGEPQAALPKHQAALEMLRDDPRLPAPTATDDYVCETLERLERLYGAWALFDPAGGYAAQAAAWRAEIEAEKSRRRAGQE
jgi:hypothetical protein